ncbi:MAG: hypothetical protein C0403_19670 [Desulfobacterium sp.]|nr:hypothetical protein [Desulfobacterium sp.]
MKKATLTKKEKKSEKMVFYPASAGKENDFLAINDLSLLTGITYEDGETPEFSRAIAFGETAQKIHSMWKSGVKKFNVLIGKDRERDSIETDDGKEIKFGPELIIRQFEAVATEVKKSTRKNKQLGAGAVL